VLRSDQRPSLDQNAAKIRDNADWKTVVIEGHCDERGSEEYNLALGDRRASAVKRYFMDSGISGGRIDTVSYGESQPAATGHDESSWRLNRRAEFTVVR
jgi:peptidoglycan-associated lipoprotein